MGKFKGFDGVFSSDNAPLVTKVGKSIIINFDKRSEPGSHFIAVYINKAGKCLYFDPLNITHIPIDIHNYLSKYKIFENASCDIQPFFSTYCGFYCMLFIISNLISSKYWKSIKKKFKNMKENDSKCIKLLCISIKKYLTMKK